MARREERVRRCGAVRGGAREPCCGGAKGGPLAWVPPSRGSTRLTLGLVATLVVAVLAAFVLNEEEEVHGASPASRFDTVLRMTALNDPLMVPLHVS